MHYFYVTDSGIESVPANLVEAIGIDQYKIWKGMDKLFKVYDALSAADFAVHVIARAETKRLVKVASWYISSILKHYGITDFYMGTVYSINRGIEVQVYRGDYVAYRTEQGFDPDDLHGQGMSITMAIADLHRQLMAENVTSFLP